MEHLRPETLLFVCARASHAKTPQEAFEGDLSIARAVARAIETRPVSKLVYFSSIAVYGDAASDFAVTEQTRLDPTNLYGAAKEAAEHLLTIAAAKGKTPLLLLRPGMVYGPQDRSTAYGPARLIRQALDGEVRLFGDGSEVRDNLYVDDLAEAAVALSLGARTGIFNLASGEPRSFRDIVSELERLKGSPVRVVEAARDRPKTDQRLDLAKLRTVLPYWRPIPLSEGLARAWRAAYQERSHA